MSDNSAQTSSSAAADRPQESTPDGSDSEPVVTKPSMFADPNTPLLEQMGGIKGLITSSLPVLAFVPVNAIWGLTAAMWAAIVAAIVLLLWTIARREKLQPAISGFFAVAVCVLIAWRTGDAKGYFLYGIITQAVYALVFIISSLVRWPLVGVIWAFVAGIGQRWRSDRRIMGWYHAATWVWAAIFGVRFVLQAYLYSNDDVTWLGVARIAMGWPLAVVGFLVTVIAVERAGHRTTTPTPDPTQG